MGSRSPRAEALHWAGSYNEAFATHWGAPQFAPAELEDMIIGLKEVLVRDFTVFAEAGGRIVGSIFAMPDFHQLMRGADKVDHGVLLTISVTPAFRGRGLNLAMAARSYLAMIRHGYRSASYTTVLDSNRASRLTAEKLGARVGAELRGLSKDAVILVAAAIAARTLDDSGIGTCEMVRSPIITAFFR